MRFVIQRVLQAAVKINGAVFSEIGTGMLIFIGIHQEDCITDVKKWADKVLKLRIFPDEHKPINRSIRDIDGEILVVSQFTLYADCKGQNRPSFIQAAPPNVAEGIYQNFVTELKSLWPRTQSGKFAADMQVSLVNDGPVTILLD